MTKAEKICKDVRKDLKDQVITATKAMLAMQDKIEEQIPIYKELQLAQEVTVGTGETILRANPAAQEFRALVRDYTASINVLTEMIESNKQPVKATTLDDFRKFKVVGK